MEKLKHNRKEQGGFSEAWVGSVYIVYGLIGLTLAVKYGALNAAMIMVLVPFFTYVIGLMIVDEVKKENPDYFIELGKSFNKRVVRVRAFKTNLKQMLSQHTTSDEGLTPRIPIENS